MRHRLAVTLRVIFILGGLVTPGNAAAAAPPAASAAFDRYVGALEGRLAAQRGSADGFVRLGDAAAVARLRRGEAVVEKEAAATDVPGAMLHDWRGTAFMPGATAADFERVMRDFGGYPRYFAPEVLEARVDSRLGDRVQVTMRVRQQHGLTVVMDTSYDVRFGQVDARRGYSVSRSTRVAEIAAAGTAGERALGPEEEHGFLWRLNTYWSFEERDGGLYMQIESVSLTRAIPRGLGWAVRPFVESVPRESMEFTLRATCEAVRARKVGAR